MNPIVGLNTVSVFFIILSLGILLIWKLQKLVPTDLFLPAIFFLFLSLFGHISNLLEWSGSAPYLDR